MDMAQIDYPILSREAIYTFVDLFGGLQSIAKQFRDVGTAIFS